LDINPLHPLLKNVEIEILRMKRMGADQIIRQKNHATWAKKKKQANNVAYFMSTFQCIGKVCRKPLPFVSRAAIVQASWVDVV